MRVQLAAVQPPRSNSRRIANPNNAADQKWPSAVSHETSQPSATPVVTVCYHCEKNIPDKSTREKQKSGSMNQETITELSDQELLEEVKKIKPSPIMDAFFIGFLVGILIYGAAANSWGFTALIPLFLIYLFLKKSKKYEALQNELEKRNPQ